MHQIRIEHLKKKEVFRLVEVTDEMSLFDLDTVISAAFMIEDDGDVAYQSVRKNGKGNDELINLYSDEFDEFDSLEETVGDWLVKKQDELRYVSEEGMELKLTLEHITPGADIEARIIDGQGDLFLKRKKVNIEELNEGLQLELELESSLFSDVLDLISNDLAPDYLALFHAADELKKLKPWLYFNNEDVVAIQLEEMKYFVSVMGTGGQEYGLMMYDEAFGYQALELILTGQPLSEDFAMNLSALTVNYVDRDELERDDYELIKEQGLSFRGKKNWISFRSFEPGFVPVQPDYLDVEDMIRLLEAMIEITRLRMDGWVYPKAEANAYPLFEMNENEELHMLGILQMERVEQLDVEIEVNDLEIARVKKKPKSALEIEFDNFYLPTVAIEEEGRPLYPLMNVIIDRSTGEIIGHEVMPLPKHLFVQQQIFWQVLKELSVRPHRVFVSKETHRALQPVAKLVGIELVVDELSLVAELKHMLKHNPPF